jgi:hypothetical protein
VFLEALLLPSMANQDKKVDVPNSPVSVIDANDDDAELIALGYVVCSLSLNDVLCVC